MEKRDRDNLRPWWISDFWFDQSAAFARAWLTETQWTAFAEHWQSAREKVVQPKLLVVVDAPAEVLQERIRCRGRRGEQHLNLEKIERLRQSVIWQASQTGLGPVLKIKIDDENAMLNEVLAAIQSMA